MHEMSPSVIMLDFDGVVFNETYGLNMTPIDFLGEVETLRQAGYILVPNSDTPVLRMRDIADRFLGFQPKYIIAEKGAVIVIDEKKYFPASIVGLVEFRRALVQHFMFKCWAMQGDSVTTMQMFNLFQPNRKILFADMIREQTLAFYARITDREGISRPDRGWLCDVKAIVDQMVLPTGLMPFNYNEKYGIAIANASNCTKAIGYQKIRETFPSARFYMVGDSMSDFIDDGRVVQCSVANASDEYKSQCAFVAESPYTKGLVEVFQWIRSK